MFTVTEASHVLPCKNCFWWMIWNSSALLLTFEKRNILLASKRYYLLLCSVWVKARANWQKRASRSLSEYQGHIGTKMDLQFWYVWLNKLDSPSKRGETDGVFWNVKLLPHCENIGSKHRRKNILLNYTMLDLKISKLYKKD